MPGGSMSSSPSCASPRRSGWHSSLHSSSVCWPDCSGASIGSPSCSMSVGDCAVRCARPKRARGRWQLPTKMQFDLSLDLVVALFVAAAAGWLVAQFRFRDRTPPRAPPAPSERQNGLRTQEPPRRLNEDYLKGLGFLLNEEPDKALEVFLKMVDVDNETVETHFALGSIYRRRGEVERAIRIHENIMARPQLSDEHRLEAMFALAEDYFRAGLFDRA